PQRGVDDDRVEIEEANVELTAQGQPQPLLADHVQTHQRGAQLLTAAPLLGERGLELLLADLAALDEQIAQPGAASVALEDRDELVAADQALGNEDVAEREGAVAGRPTA